MVSLSKSFDRLGRVFLWGAHRGPVSYNHVSWFFLRILAIIYFIAFISFWLQVDGLIGDSGLLPVGEYLTFLEGRIGAERFYQAPSLIWLEPNGWGVHLCCGIGVFCAVLILANIFSGPALLGAWACYLSLASVAQVWLAFQWDSLLLEAGFLAIFLAPWRYRPRDSGNPSIVMIWLFRLLLFRLMFSSGLVKLLSGDESWRNLTALSYHFETQPLPTWLGWAAHQAPDAIHRFSTLVMFVIELAVPFLIFLPRRPRALAFFLTFALMLGIILTGNYTFFNWLTIAISLFLLDDEMFDAALPESVKPKAGRSGGLGRYLIAFHGFVAVMVLLVGGSQMLKLFGFKPPAPMQALEAATGPFRSINSYGLFAVMTEKRYEIVLEGSTDGERWRAFKFKWKPGDLSGKLSFVAPYQPRLDWQMWFAALSDYRQNPWLARLMVGLIQGNEPVLALMGESPFGNEPPRYIRAIIYRYQFNDWETRKATGDWWRRGDPVPYSPILDRETMVKQGTVRDGGSQRH